MILNVSAVLGNNADIVFWAIASVHSVTQTEHTRNESSFPWKRPKWRPLAVTCGSGAFRR